MELDIGDITKQIVDALKGELSEGWETISAFSEQQARMLANQAAMITQARTVGSLRDDDQLFDFFVEQLKGLTLNFARSVAMLTILTIEKAWNAIVGVVWGAINGALGAVGLASLPVPPAPAQT